MRTRPSWLILIGGLLLGPTLVGRAAAAHDYRPLAVDMQARRDWAAAPGSFLASLGERKSDPSLVTLPLSLSGTAPDVASSVSAYSPGPGWHEAIAHEHHGDEDLAPRVVRGQNYEVPPVLFTGPLSHPRYEDGGFFVGMQFLFWRQNRPLKNQEIAYRGVIDVTGNINGTAGEFIGSGEVALSTHQLQGPGTYQPGFNLSVGWRFESGTVVQLSWYHLWDARYSATAGLLGPDFNPGPLLENTFLTSMVYNFPLDFGGNALNGAGAAPGDTFGIWNAASLMTIDFIQRFDIFELTARVPMWQSENYRLYGLVGPRLAWLWERFRWRTVDADPNGLASADTQAIYSNVTSNRLYGVHAGAGQEWFLGTTPAGAFSVSLDAQASLYIDFVKGRAKYELGDRSMAATRARNMWSLVPGVEARANLWWYPWEAIQVQIGYDVMAFFNTKASPKPVDFNYGAIDPEWTNTHRFLHGLTMGVGFVF